MNRHSITIDMILPCGHRLNCSVASQALEQEEITDELIEKFMDNGKDTLQFWLKSRRDNHQCDLVSESNPCGNKQHWSLKEA